MKKGSGHFLAQRISALLLIPLTVWFCLALASLPGAAYADIVDWIRQPLNAVLLAAFLLGGIYHGELGMQVVIEDYVAPGMLRRVLLGLLRLMRGTSMMLALFFIFLISFGPLS